jgi:hypothetical protein
LPLPRYTKNANGFGGLSMNCDSVEKSIPLYFYGELAPEAEENVEAHCAACEKCQLEVEKYRMFSSALNESELEPSLDLLVECRQMLATKIRAAEQVPEPRENFWQRFFNGTHINFRVPVGAMALLAIGYFGAKLTPGLLENGLSQAGMISTVRSVQPDASGRVQISVDDVHRRVVSGDMEDQQIRQLLMTSLHEESNPGVRVESVDLLNRMASSEDVRNALLDRLQNDPNPGVRLKALDGLKQFSSNPGVRKTLSEVLLNDSNPGVRIEVIDLLASHHDDSMVGVLQNLVRKEDNKNVRVRLERALQEMNASVGTF